MSRPTEDVYESFKKRVEQDLTRSLQRFKEGSTVSQNGGENECRRKQRQTGRKKNIHKDFEKIWTCVRTCHFFVLLTTCVLNSAVCFGGTVLILLFCIVDVVTSQYVTVNTHHLVAFGYIVLPCLSTSCSMIKTNFSSVCHVLIHNSKTNITQF